MARSGSYEDDYADEPGREDGGSFTDQLDLQQYLRILRKHKWPITLFTALITCLAAYYAFTATPVYSATSTLLIEPQGTNPVTFEGLVGADTETQDYYETQFELLKSRQLAFRVIDAMDLWNLPELSPKGGGAGAARDPGSTGAATTGSGIEAGSPEEAAGGFRAALDSVVSQLGLGGDKSAAETGVTPTGDNATGTATGAEVDTSVIVDTEAMTTTTSSTTDPVRSMSVADPNDPNSISQELDMATMLDVPETTPRQQTVMRNFMSRLTIAPVRKTKLVKISFESTDPALAARVSNMVGEQYIDSYLDAKMELTTKAATWLNERLQALKGTLDESEDRLIAFKQAEGLVDVDGSVGRLNEQELLLVTAELATARSELADAADLSREVAAVQARPELLESIPTVRSDPLIQQVKIEQGQAQRELDELLNRYGERHPRVVDAKSQLASLDTNLRGHIERVAGTIQKDYQLLQQRVATIQGKLATGKQEIQAIGTKKFELDALEREVATNQSIYDTFFNRMTEARSADGLDNANARVADYAVAPLQPVKPKKQLIIALAALASLVLSMLMAFLYEQMDDTIKGTSDVERKLGVNLLGILPLIKTGVFGKRDASGLPLDPTTVADKKGTFAESVNTVRTALSLGDGDAPRKVIMVTSSIPGEGKSTVSLNLAYSMAQLERVLIVDCDLRRPTMGKVAGLDRVSSGLTDLIMGAAPARDCIKRGMFDGSMDVLPAGRPVDQPLELLSSKRFAKIIEQLCEHYDRIVLDCAPTQAVSDALVISKIADSVVFAIKSHDTSIELARRGLQRLGQVNANIAGVVITQVDIDKIVSYGGDHYYQGYYDYYGYNDNGDKVGGDRLHLSHDELISIKSDDRDVALDLDYGYGNGGPAERGSSDRGPSDRNPSEQGPSVDRPRRSEEARVERTRVVETEQGVDRRSGNGRVDDHDRTDDMFEGFAEDHQRRAPERAGFDTTQRTDYDRSSDSRDRRRQDPNEPRRLSDDLDIL